MVAQTTQSLQEQTQLLTQDTLVSLQQAVQSLQDRMQEESRKVRQSTEQEITKTAEAFSANRRSALGIGNRLGTICGRARSLQIKGCTTRIGKKPAGGRRGLSKATRSALRLGP